MKDDDDEDVYEDVQDFLGQDSFYDEYKKMESNKAKMPIVLNVHMVGKNEPFKFKILHKDPFSKVLKFISGLVKIPSDKFILKWGAIILDPQEVKLYYYHFISFF